MSYLFTKFHYGQKQTYYLRTTQGENACKKVFQLCLFFFFFQNIVTKKNSAQKVHEREKNIVGKGRAESIWFIALTSLLILGQKLIKIYQNHVYFLYMNFFFIYKRKKQNERAIEICYSFYKQQTFLYDLFGRHLTCLEILNKIASPYYQSI